MRKEKGEERYMGKEKRKKKHWLSMFFFLSTANCKIGLQQTQPFTLPT